MNGDTMTDKRTDEVLGPEVNYIYWKQKFEADFMVFIDHKITSHKGQEIHILNVIGTLAT